MAKLLDADWLRGAQLFHSMHGIKINDFSTVEADKRLHNTNFPVCRQRQHDMHTIII